MVLTEQKRNYLERLSTKDGVISALAFDQRGALKRLMAKYQDTEPTVAQMEEWNIFCSAFRTDAFDISLFFLVKFFCTIYIIVEQEFHSICALFFDAFC